VWAYGGWVATGRAPGVENASDPGEHALEVGRLLLQERSDVDARGRSGASECDDLLDFDQGEPKSARLGDERQQLQHVNRIASVAGWCASGRGKDAARLVQPQGLAAQPASRRDFADEQPVLHERQDTACPLGQGQELSKLGDFFQGPDVIGHPGLYGRRDLCLRHGLQNLGHQRFKVPAIVDGPGRQGV